MNLEQQLKTLMPDMIVGGKAMERLEEYINDYYIRKEHFEELQKTKDDFALTIDRKNNELDELRKQLAELQGFIEEIMGEIEQTDEYTPDIILSSIKSLCENRLEGIR